ncbi:MAG: hypothetical protein KF870_16285 [Leadbetterella sp.]|nr:hypothetical protein [Leadbetterella sp.]
MKNITIYMACLVLVLITGRCKEMNPFEGVSLVVSDGKVNSPVLLQFVDANPENETAPDKITVKITGDKAAYVLNDAGKRNFSPTRNILTLKLARGIVASPSAPVKFTVEAEAPGYLTSRRTFTLTGTEPVQLVMPLVNLKAPPKGVTSVQANVSTSGGKFSLFNTSPSARIAASKAGTSLREAAGSNTHADSGVGSVAFQPGTQVMDAAGNVINTDNVNAEIYMCHYNKGNSFVLFPTNLIQENVLFKSGERHNIQFTVVGLATIRMNAGGKEIKKFSKPLEVSMLIPDDIRNPQTREAIKEGAIIPTWSFDEGTSKWKEEGVAVVSKNSNGELEAKFEVSHLSYWSISYFSELKNACAASTGLKVTSNINYNLGSYYGILFDEKGNKLPLEYYYTGGEHIRTANGSLCYIDCTNFNGIYEGDKLKLKIMENGTGKVVGEADITVNFSCTNQSTIPITITIPDPPKPVALGLNLTAVCERKGLLYKPSGWVSLNQDLYTNYHDDFFTYFEDGKLDGSTYVFERTYRATISYQGTWNDFDVHFGRKETRITKAGGDHRFRELTPTYNAALDMITITGDFVLPDCN